MCPPISCDSAAPNHLRPWHSTVVIDQLPTRNDEYTQNGTISDNNNLRSLKRIRRKLARALSKCLLTFFRIPRSLKVKNKHLFILVSFGTLTLISLPLLLTFSSGPYNDTKITKSLLPHSSQYVPALKSPRTSTLKTNLESEYAIQPAPLRSVGILWNNALNLTRSDQTWLDAHYQMTEKTQPYVGLPATVMRSLQRGSNAFFNSLAVFAGHTENSQHGRLGLLSNNTDIWIPKTMPPPLNQTEDGGKQILKESGGFYLALSDALPLSRALPDLREKSCRKAHYDVNDLPDASIIITFYNEPLSTLLRTVNSVLNTSPPQILNEIILVDDHSDVGDKQLLMEHLRTLPKTKLLSLPERKGIVLARLAGARLAQASVLVFLDSHVELNRGWLEPQLARIKESPKSVVFPQILSLSSSTFEPDVTIGIGCYVSFRWTMVEQSSLTRHKDNDDLLRPISSPSMAGGLFAVDKDFFWDIGGYDEEFKAWGAENVEMGFRVWMCGGRIECIPCSKTFHIYRSGGVGYKNPENTLWWNRMRTAKIWLDEAHFRLASKMISLSQRNQVDFGSIEKMLKFKEAKQCKPFDWYLQKVDPTHELQTLDELIGLGRFRHMATDRCLDLAGSRGRGSPIKSFACHQAGSYNANQGFFAVANDSRIRLMTLDKRCVGAQAEGGLTIENCSDKEKAQVWLVSDNSSDGHAVVGNNQLYTTLYNKVQKKCLGIERKGDFVWVPSCDHLDARWKLDRDIDG